MYCAVLGRPGDKDVVGDHDRAGVQPAPVENAQQIDQISVFVVVEKYEIQCAGGESVVCGKRVQRAATVADGAHHAGDPIGDTGMRPDLAGIDGVGFGQLDGVHVGPRRRAGDAQRPIAAVGAQLESHLRLRSPNGCVEQRPLLVADIDQHRLLVGEPVDGCDHIVDVARSGVREHVLDCGRFTPVTDLARRGDVAGAGRHPPKRPPQQGDALLETHGRHPSPPGDSTGATKFAGGVVAGLPAQARIPVRLCCDVRYFPTAAHDLAINPAALMSDHADSGIEVGLTGRPPRAIPEPKPRSSHGPAKVVAMCNQKGGVGKTTSTINLGAALAEYGRRVLLVDLDPQGALSAGLGVPHYELEHTIHNLLIEPRVSLDNVLMHTRVKNLDLVPSNIDLSAAEIQLVNEVGREHTLSRALHPVLDRYDYVLIDCQPSLGLLTVNGLACSDGVVIPTECEFFSLRGLALLTDTVEKVRDRLNPKLDISGILITRYDPRTVNSREVMARVVERFGDLVFDTVISRTVRFPETTVAGEPITSWAPKSGGAAAYRSLAREVIDRFGA